MPTKIEWCQETWNPVTGCTPVSEGCEHCYARRMAQRLAGRFGYPADEPFRPGVIHEDRVDPPFRWRKPRLIFVCSMGDLFHEAVPLEVVGEIWRVMRSCQRHTFIVLTKRPQRMRDWLYWASKCGWDSISEGWPLPNVWLGVSVENQRRAEERIPVLLECPAAVRFVSCEPLLGPVNLMSLNFCRGVRANVLEGCGVDPRLPAQSIPNMWCPRLDWVIVGAETGPDARPMHPDWARAIRDQCIEAGVPFFLGRLSDGSRRLDGRLWEQWPRRC